MTHRTKRIIIAVLIAIGLFTGACAVEGGVSGREVCMNCEESK